MPDSPSQVAQPADISNPLHDTGSLAVVAGGILVFIGLLALMSQPPWRHTTVWFPLLFIVASSTPFFIVGRELRGRAAPWAVGAASALAGITVLTTLAVTVLGFMTGIFSYVLKIVPIFLASLYMVEAASLLEHNVPSGVYWLLLVLVVICIALWRSARRARRGLKESTRPRAGVGALASWGYAMVGIPLFISAFTRTQQRRITNEADAAKVKAQLRVAVRRSLRRMQVCLLSYEYHHPGEGFPRTLDAAPSCVDSATSRKPFTDVRVRYASGSDSAARGAGFWIVAEPMSKLAPFADEFYADGRGEVYRADVAERSYALTLGRKLPDSPLPPSNDLLEVIDSPLSSLRDLEHCLVEKSRSSSPRYPMSIQRSDCARPLSLHQDEPLTFPVGSRFDYSGPSGSYTLVYHRRDSSKGKVVGFSIESRPFSYGIDGVRSYYLDESGQIHWTRDDRAATVGDPVVDDCLPTRQCS